MPRAPKWDLPHLRRHIQYAVDLELWTIPFYMSAMYSIRDPTTEAYQLIQSIVYQEMLHLQLAANISNAFGKSPKLGVPAYVGTEIPHLDFALDTPDPRPEYSPYSAEIGPLDEKRINAMCLIEYPEWDTGGKPDFHDDVKNYGSIGEFYDALQYGVAELQSHIRGNRRQVSLFARHYANFPQQTITADGADGYVQMRALFEAIREQGEGAHKGEGVPPQFENTADDPAPDEDHFTKFSRIRKEKSLPATYPGETDPKRGSAAAKAQHEVVKRFGKLLHSLEELFGGNPPDDFGAVMAATGAAIGNCWKLGAVPRFGGDS